MIQDCATCNHPHYDDERPGVLLRTHVPVCAVTKPVPTGEIGDADSPLRPDIIAAASERYWPKDAPVQADGFVWGRPCGCQEGLPSEAAS